MPFYIQYDTATGQISGTVSGQTAPEKFPAGRAQLEFKEWCCCDNMMVDVKGKCLIKAPQIDIAADVAKG